MQVEKWWQKNGKIVYRRLYFRILHSEKCSHGNINKAHLSSALVPLSPCLLYSLSSSFSFCRNHWRYIVKFRSSILPSSRNPIMTWFYSRRHLKRWKNYDINRYWHRGERILRVAYVSSTVVIFITYWIDGVTNSTPIILSSCMYRLLSIRKRLPTRRFQLLF